jgi:hypothetical protein
LLLKEIVTGSFISFLVCRDSWTFAANGTIQPVYDGINSSRQCGIYISAAYDQYIELTCSVVNLTSVSSYLQVSLILKYWKNLYVNTILEIWLTDSSTRTPKATLTHPWLTEHTLQVVATFLCLLSLHKEIGLNANGQRLRNSTRRISNVIRIY